MTPPMPIRVLVLHVEALTQAGLSATAGRQADMAVQDPGIAAAQASLARWLLHQQVDVVICDHERGVRLARELQQVQIAFGPSRPRVIVVGRAATQAEVRLALKAGVAGYVPATSPSEEFVDAVRKVHLGMRHISPAVAHRLLDDMLEEQLTPRETEVLRLAAQGFPNKVIAARLQVELGTVKCHMRAVMAKLRVANRTQAVVVANERGLLLLGEPHTWHGSGELRNRSGGLDERHVRPRTRATMSD